MVVVNVLWVRCEGERRMLGARMLLVLTIRDVVGETVRVMADEHVVGPVGTRASWDSDLWRVPRCADIPNCVGLGLVICIELLLTEPGGKVDASSSICFP